jgi:polysaccharide export outer membrane protein
MIFLASILVAALSSTPVAQAASGEHQSVAPQAPAGAQKPAPPPAASGQKPPAQPSPSGQPSAPQAPAQSAGQTPTSYRIGAQDTILITVVDEPELSGKFAVDAEGMFSYPYLNRVRAAGLTATELQNVIATQLKAGYLRNPQVRVEVDLFRSQSVMIVGDVRQPGKIAMTGPTMTLLEALVLAGSPTAAASSEIIVRHRPVDGKEAEEIRVNRRDLELGKSDVVLRDGDIINVPSAQRFYVDGQVRNPGYYVLDPGMTVQQAIALAGGLTERGSDRGVSATRIVNGKSTDVSLRLDDKVQANDVIRIRQRFF